ncbi:Hypothetical protein PHPALM_11431 [Phytophthora palmivora]|uniref:Uncharacterized protein n=1 Tax=Phytophthora palmivora TaxID=4796 RepID=A0A2P4Y2A6_9STRA|nr:Hypothetical protein PHPALM_11431 [Phytophthora palmivora]
MRTAFTLKTTSVGSACTSLRRQGVADIMDRYRATYEEYRAHLQRALAVIGITEAYLGKQHLPLPSTLLNGRSKAAWPTALYNKAVKTALQADKRSPSMTPSSVEQAITANFADIPRGVVEKNQNTPHRNAGEVMPNGVITLLSELGLLTDTSVQTLVTLRLKSSLVLACTKHLVLSCAAISIS